MAEALSRHRVSRSCPDIFAVNELHSSCTSEASISPFDLARMGLVSASYLIVDNEWVWVL